MLIFEDNNPIGIIAVALCDGEFNIMEFIISPDKRGKGIGPEILKELLTSGKSIIGAEILNAIAVIFPDNIQSQKAFEKTGFKYESKHADEDVLYYRYLR